jgi:hypothetical protein
LLVAAVALLSLLFAVLYNAADGEVYLLPVVMALAIWAGLGAAWLLREGPRIVRRLGPAALAGAVVWQVVSAWPLVDVSRDREARLWGEALLRDAPPGALVRSSSDRHTFVLWYLQHVERLRPDVAIVDDRLLAFGWYRRQVRRQYPHLGSEVP